MLAFIAIDSVKFLNKCLLHDVHCNMIKELIKCSIREIFKRQLLINRLI